MIGVSVVICTHNGATRLPKVLEHLRLQHAAPRLQWEVIVIDNASSDDTSRVAQACWEGFQGAKLSVIPELRLGLTYARLRGLSVAKHEIVSFVDDDNWVAPNWVSRVSQVMTENPKLGAVGPLVYPAFEKEPPNWWYESPRDFAILLEAPSCPQDRLAGAGMTIRKEAWRGLELGGFQMRLTDRMGKRLLWGGDLEMTFALHHAGWELEVDSELRMLHYLEAHRLSWQYFRRMQRWSGVSAVMLSACTDSIAGRKRAWSLNTCWQRYALGVVKRLILSPHSVWLWLFSTREDSRVLEVEREIGKLTGLLTMRAEFNRPYGSRVRSFEPDVQRRRDYLR